jgi:GNAT superfamily N-acetyltransferase
MSDLTLTTLGNDGIHDRRDDLLNVYADVYVDRLDDPFFSIPRYWERLEAYATRDGFGLVIGDDDTGPIGYAMGFTLPAGSGWWRGLTTDIDPELLVEDGTRTVAVTEIMVLASMRRRGYARAMHDALLQGRSERRATLLVLPDNRPAQAAYAAWGWHKIGDLKPFDDAPTYDAMILNLEPNR